jgi:uncharacterized protein
VKSGDVVKVKVLEVDEARQRIGLTLRLDDEVGAGRKNDGPRGGGQRQDRRGGGQPQDRRGGKPQQQQGGRDRGRDSRPAPGGSMADALRKAGFGK